MDGIASTITSSVASDFLSATDQSARGCWVVRSINVYDAGIGRIQDLLFEPKYHSQGSTVPDK